MKLTLILWLRKGLYRIIIYSNKLNKMFVEFKIKLSSQILLGTKTQ